VQVSHFQDTLPIECSEWLLYNPHYAYLDKTALKGLLSEGLPNICLKL